MTQPDELTRKVPDYAETRLAFRVWRFDRARNVLRSVNAGQATKKPTWRLQRQSLFPKASGARVN